MTTLPITNPIDNSSSEASTVSALLTEQPGDLSSYIPKHTNLTSDQMLEMSFLLDTYTWNSTTLSNVSGLNMFNFGRKYLPRSAIVAHPIAYINSHYYYDHDLVIDFRFFKHSRARGKLMVLWYPGLNTNVTNLATLRLTQGATFGTRSSKTQREIVDLEKEDTHKITLIGNKLYGVRSLMKTQDATTINPALRLTALPEISTKPSYVFGTLMIIVESPFSSGNVGADTVDFDVTLTFANMKGYEYHGLQGSTYQNVNTYF